MCRASEGVVKIAGFLTFVRATPSDEHEAEKCVLPYRSKFLAMKNMYILPLLLAFICISFMAAAGVPNNAIANGDWSVATTWSQNRAPQSGDDITVPVGTTVTVDINSPTYSAMAIYVYGTLHFNGGQKINLDCDGYVYVGPTGQLTGGNPGSKINICGSTVWNGPGPTSGPVSYGTNPLPIELVSFSAILFENTRIKISWTTATETNNDYFTVERSRNGASFEAVARVEGSGTSTSQKSYSAIDSDPLEGTSYYRLKQTDNNGNSEAFNLVAVEFKRTASGCVLKVYPNPCMGLCNVELAECNNEESSEIEVELIDAAGNKVYSHIPERDSRGSFSLSIDTKNNLKPGVYIVRGYSKSEQYNKKVIVK